MRVEYRLLRLQGAVQIRSLVASLPAGLPTVRCCSAVAMVRELGGHPGSTPSVRWLVHS